jgi:hypothetical protein
MRRGNKGALALAFVLALTLALLGVTGCGEDLSEAEEGVPIKLGELEFNVQETRFLNPAQPDDSEYLAGQQLPPPRTQSYLGVFLTIHNDADEGAAYEAIPSNTPFAAPLGTDLAGGAEIPAPDSAAASGPVQGGIVLFLMDEGVTENRPLELEIEYEGETGVITLDI